METCLRGRRASHASAPLLLSWGSLGSMAWLITFGGDAASGRFGVCLTTARAQGVSAAQPRLRGQGHASPLDCPFACGQRKPGHLSQLWAGELITVLCGADQRLSYDAKMHRNVLVAGGPDPELGRGPLRGEHADEVGERRQERSPCVELPLVLRFLVPVSARPGHTRFLSSDPLKSPYPCRNTPFSREPRGERSPLSQPEDQGLEQMLRT